jgi:hypothetical protein
LRDKASAGRWVSLNSKNIIIAKKSSNFAYAQDHGRLNWLTPRSADFNELLQLKMPAKKSAP